MQTAAEGSALPRSLPPLCTHLVAVPHLGAGGPPLQAGAREAGGGVGRRKLRVLRSPQVLPADVPGPESGAVLHFPEAHGAPRGQGNTAPFTVIWKAHGKGGGEKPEREFKPRGGLCKVIRHVCHSQERAWRFTVLRDLGNSPK